MQTWFKDTQEFTGEQIRNAHPNTAFGFPFDPSGLGYAFVFDTPAPTVTTLEVAYQDGTEIDAKGNRVQKWSIRPMFSDYTDDLGVLHTQAEQEVQYLIDKRKAMVPQSIQKYQAELILHDMGMLPSIQAVISADTAMSIVYQGVTTFDRTNGIITQVSTLQNISDDVIDKMFIAASRYTAEMATDQSAREAIMREVGLL